ncbi:MAG: NAD(P)-dependent oxidoreductase [Candidatus Tectomicrobia bacterium]|nr:NAD(P)-dependent oxidoreductase [Candidatus Tectomicrobia bacterium]
MRKVLITGGAGYIGSLLTGTLLAQGHEVTVVDALMFGGESLLGFFGHPRFRFAKADVTQDALDELLPGIEIVYHLAAIVGFPACQQVGDAVAYKYNTEATKRVFEASERAGVERFILASTYSNYGIAPNGEAVTEESPLNPQSLYARTKIAAEEWLLERGRASRCAPIIPRFATLFGISPRTRFDLIVNQFVLEALRHRKLVIYQRDYFRSFVHVADVVDALLLLQEAPLPTVRNQIFNVGSETGNHSKQEIVTLVQKHVPGVTVEVRDLSFGEDMRDVRVSFEKIRCMLGFLPLRTVEDGIIEVLTTLESGLIPEPTSPRYRNHQFIVN